MRIEELDDPRAREAIRAAIRVADAAVALNVAEWTDAEEDVYFGRLIVAQEEFDGARDAYKALLKELGKHEQVVYYAEPPGEEKSGPPAEAER